MTHTPGPWEICYDGVNVYAPESDTAITNVEHPCAPDGLEQEDNAVLIAAAPDLLEACRDAANQLRTIAALLNHIPKKYAAHISPTIRYGDIDAAIAKAEPKP